MAVQYRSDALRRALRTLHTTATDVRASVIANSDGMLMMANAPDGEAPLTAGGTETVAAMSAVLLSLAQQTLLRMARGQVERIIVQGGAGTVVVTPAASDAVLAVLVTHEARLGVTLHAIGRCSAELQRVLMG